MKKHFHFLFSVFVVLTLMFVLMPGPISASGQTTVPVINEFSASTTGTDIEFVEIYGDPETDYSLYTFLEIEGDSGTAAGTVDEVLPIGTTDAGGFWLMDLAANTLENGTISLLLVENFSGAAGDDLDTNDDGLFDITPWDAIVDAVAVNDGGAGDVTYGVPALGVSYDGLSFAPGGASRIPDGLDTDSASDWVRNDFDLAGIPGFDGTPVEGEALNTPGEPNQVYVPPPPPEPNAPVINEFSASTTGTDIEYVEIYGDADTDYSAYSLLEVEGDGTESGSIDEVVAVGTTDAIGIWFVNLPVNALENGTLTLLLVKNFTGSAGADLDTNNDGAFEVTPWDAIVDEVSVNDGGVADLTYGLPILGPNYDGLGDFAPGGASRFPDGYDTDSASDWARNDFDLAGIPGYTGTLEEGEAFNTPGEPNQIYQAPPPEPSLVINEFSASTTGTDVEYVEVYGDPETDYSAYTLLEIEGDTTGAGVIDEIIPIGTTDASGFWLGDLEANALENGTISLLLVKNFTGTAGDDLDSENDGVFDVTPWDAIVDAVAVNDGGAGDVTYGVPALGVSYDGLSFAPGGASRIPDGLDTDSASDWVRNDFDLAGIPGYTGTLEEGEALNTPGDPNQVYQAPPPAGTPVINEFSASTTGTDIEYVEVYGDPESDYSAYTLLEIEGDSGASAGTIDEVITIGTTDASGFWLDDLAPNVLENGTLTLLLVANFSGNLGDDLDSDNDGVFEVTPWSAVVDAVAVNDGGAGDVTYGIPALGVSYDGLSFAPGGASRIPDGLDTDSASDWMRNDFDLAGIIGFGGTPVVGEAINTPGAPNEAYVPPPEGCGDPFTPIYEVQGSAADSPLAGTEVSVEGVVVGDFQNNGMLDNGDLNGFHVQDLLGDGDAATSDGVFIYAPGGIDVAPGDAVRVRGTVSEYNGLTEISASQIWICASGLSVAPTQVSLPVASVDALEAYEGMLITFPQPLVISEYFNFDRFGEIVLTSQRHTTPTAEFEPGFPDVFQAIQDYLLDRITLDDGRGSQNPDPAIHPNGGVFDLDNLFRGGDTVTNVTGVLDYGFGLYRIQPTMGADYTNVNVRPEEPDPVGGNVKVAAFNVLNYFTTIDTGAWICGPSGDMECRGADTELELERQRAKILAALKAIDADVVGLIEIQNDEGAAVADLVAGLNDLMGAGTYAYVDTGFIGTDAIKQALIYKPAAVSLVGDYAILDTSVDARFLDEKNRPVLAQTFIDNTDGGIFTVAVNHLKSKGSPCDDVYDPDTKDGSGNCNLTRLAAAQALVDWLASDPTGSGDSDFLIIGDLNAYDKEDPIDAIKAGPDDVPGTDDDYTELVFHYLGEYAYSYVFDGQTGYLDHSLASAGLTGETTGVTIWHINADEADLTDYDMSFKQDTQDAIYAPNPFRSSDHDPVITGLDVCDEIPPTLEVSLSPNYLWPVNHKYMDVEATVIASDNFDPNPTVTLVSVTSNEPDDTLGDGMMLDDIVIVDDFHFQLRAERSALGTGRVYTITYMVTDACGNTTYQSATVYVPLNQGLH